MRDLSSVDRAELEADRERLLGRPPLSTPRTPRTPPPIGETVVFALVGARAFGVVLAQQIRKRGPEEVDDDADEPGAVVGFLLIAGTYAAAAVAVREGAGLAGVPVSWIGAGLFGLLVTLSLALEYGVIAADRLALK